MEGGLALSPSIVAKAEHLVSALVNGYSTLSNDEVQQDQPPLDEWLHDLGQLRIASPFALPPRVFCEAWAGGEVKIDLGPTPAELISLCRRVGRQVDCLVPFAGNIFPTGTAHTHLLHAACWSRTTVLKVADARNAFPALVQGLGAVATAFLDHVVQHAVSVCQLPQPFLQLWQEDRREIWLEARDRRGRVNSLLTHSPLTTHCPPLITH